MFFGPSIAFPFNTSEPAWKMIARFQIETLSLMSRRAQAYLELPQALASCTSPQEMLTEQVKFCQIAQRHYAQTAEKVVGAIPLPGKATAPLAKAKTARDYMIVAETPAPQAARKEPAAVQSQPAADAPRLRRSA